MRRPLLLASIALLAALIAGSFWLHHHRAATRRFAAWQEQQRDAVTRERLERLITLEGGPMSLADFAALIEKHSGLAVEFDEPSLAITRYPTQPADTIPVQVPKGTLTLHSALRLTLEPDDLWADLRGQTLRITTLDQSVDRIRLTTVVYPLPPNAPAGIDEEAWRELIASNLFSPWVPAGYTQMTTHVGAVPGALVVVHTADGHRRVRQVIAAICRLGESEKPQSPITIPPPPPGTMERQILAALDHPATAEFVEQPLRDVMNYLAEQHDIPLILMVQKLAEASVSVDTPITKNLKNISLRSALHLILQDLELTFVLRNEALLVTTPEDAESEEITMVYPVGNLVETDAGPDFDQLIDLITIHVEPHSWPSFSGPSPIEGIGEGFLLFTQTWHFHQQVAKFLSHLRRILSSPQSSQVISVVDNPESDQKLRTALEHLLALDHRNVRLRDVLAKFQNELDIPIVLAAKKLEEASVSPDTPVTCSLPQAPAKTQLRTLLAPLELTYVIRDEVLIITTPEDAESQILTRLYDIRSLISTDMSGQQLCDQLERDVNPPSWDAVGGPGSVSVYRGILVVGQTELVHEDIEKWLTDLRAKRANESPAPTNP